MGRSWILRSYGQGSFSLFSTLKAQSHHSIRFNRSNHLPIIRGGRHPQNRIQDGGFAPLILLFRNICRSRRHGACLTEQLRTTILIHWLPFCSVLFSSEQMEGMSVILTNVSSVNIMFWLKRWNLVVDYPCSLSKIVNKHKIRFL